MKFIVVRNAFSGQNLIKNFSRKLVIRRDAKISHLNVSRVDSLWYFSVDRRVPCETIEVNEKRTEAREENRLLSIC